MKLIRTTEPADAVALSPEANETRIELLAKSQSVVAVTNDDEKSVATIVIRELDAHLRAIEEAREAVKRPFLEIGRKIDQMAREHTEALTMHRKRLSSATAMYAVEKYRLARAEAERLRAEQEAEVRRQQVLRDAEIKRQLEEKQRIEAEAAKVAASGEDGADLEAELMRETAAQLAEPPPPPVAPAPIIVAPAVEAKGIRKDIAVEVFDIDALYKAFPAFVTLTPNLSMIKAAIKNNAKLPGVRHTETAAVVARR